MTLAMRAQNKTLAGQEIQILVRSPRIASLLADIFPNIDKSTIGETVGDLMAGERTGFMGELKASPKSVEFASNETAIFKSEEGGNVTKKAETTMPVQEKNEVYANQDVVIAKLKEVMGRGNETAARNNFLIACKGGPEKLRREVFPVDLFDGILDFVKNQSEWAKKQKG
jgi:hypothetical protein